MPSYEELVAQTLALCAQIENSPEARLHVREAFYQRLISLDPKAYLGKEEGGQGPYGYGNAEIAFLQWEIKRGVLNPLNDKQQAGSTWWRNVNLRFIYYAELAGSMFAHQVTYADAPITIQKWLAFLESPSSKTWYVAHNTSILAGFEEYLVDAQAENSVEQEFLNITLYRLLFAQALVEDATIFGEIGAFVADPKGFSVKLITSLPDFYPTHYPLTEADRDIIEGKEHSIEDHLVYILDSEIILPHIMHLYKEATRWDSAPFLLSYLDNKQPCYPYPNV